MVSVKTFLSRFSVIDVEHFVVVFVGAYATAWSASSLPFTKDALIALVPGALAVAVHQLFPKLPVVGK